MSNPAVTKLVRDDIGNLRFWMDDNIGESVHIHLADFRMDLTVEELDKLSAELTDTVNQLVDIEGFDCNKMDPVFLSLLLAKKMKHLRSVQIDRVMLEDLIVNHRNRFGFLKYQKLSESRAVKALNGDNSENDGSRRSHHIGQTSRQRLDAMKDSISEHGYPYDGQYIVLYEDQMLIRDGQHRASCLYVSEGNIEIPVLRLFFDDPKVAAYETSYVKQLIAGFRKITGKHLKKALKKMAKTAWHTGIGIKNRIYFIFHKKKLKKMEQIYFQ
ncbi:MAG: hypothetical protein ACI4A3_03245 [Lachnospiraceae bacterium]